MRNSKKAQALADNCAKAHGFFCASYRGCSSEELVYVKADDRRDKILTDKYKYLKNQQDKRSRLGLVTVLFITPRHPRQRHPQRNHSVGT